MIRVKPYSYVDAEGDAHAPCATCGVDCSTHPDAGNPLDRCGDCGAVTCPDHREETTAARCPGCHARHAADVAADQLRELHDRVIERVDAGESLDAAIEAVTGSGRGPAFDRVRAYALGQRSPAPAADQLPDHDADDPASVARAGWSHAAADQLQTFPVELLTAAARGDIDLNDIARATLAGRGLDVGRTQ